MMIRTVLLILSHIKGHTQIYNLTYDTFFSLFFHFSTQKRRRRLKDRHVTDVFTETEIIVQLND